MRFTPLTEEQLSISNLLEKGQYRFRVLESKDRVSQSGNDMIFLKLGVEGMDGKERFVFCNLLSHAMLHITKHFCDTTGLQEKYQDGTLLAKDCDNKTGYVDIDLGEGEDKNKNKVMRNIVKDFIVAEKFKEPEQSLNPDQDIPF